MANTTDDKEFVPEPGKFFQNVVFLKQQIRTGIFKKEHIVIPITSSTILSTFDEARQFANIFINQLIENGDIPEEAIVNNTINDSIIKTAIQTIRVGAIEYV